MAAGNERSNILYIAAAAIALLLLAPYFGLGAFLNHDNSRPATVPRAPVAAPRVAPQPDDDINEELFPAAKHRPNIVDDQRRSAQRSSTPPSSRNSLSEIEELLGSDERRPEREGE